MFLYNVEDIYSHIPRRMKSTETRLVWSRRAEKTRDTDMGVFMFNYIMERHFSIFSINIRNLDENLFALGRTLYYFVDSFRSGTKVQQH